MLPDPQTVTIDGTAHSMARKAVPGFPGKGALRHSNDYATADGSVRLRVEQYQTRAGHRYVQVYLGKRISEPDAVSFNDTNRYGTWNSFGITLVFDEYRSEIESLADVRAALDSFVDSTILSRLIAGES